MYRRLLIQLYKDRNIINLKVRVFIRELKKFDPEGDILFFDENNFYSISEKLTEQGVGIYVNEIRKTYNIKIEKKKNKF